MIRICSPGQDFSSRSLACPSSAGFKPQERAILFPETKMPDSHFGKARKKLQKRTVAHHGNAIDPSVMFRNELEMREKRVKAPPARKRLRADHDANEFLARRNCWIDLARRSLEVHLLGRTIRSDDQDRSVAQQLAINHAPFPLMGRALALELAAGKIRYPSPKNPNSGRLRRVSTRPVAENHP